MKISRLNLIAIIFGLNIPFVACTESGPLSGHVDETTETISQIPEKAYVLAEQSRRAIIIRDAVTQQNVWEWEPYTACVPSSSQDLFNNPSEVKPVYNNRYILMTASGGAVALIRISDHKLMFYADCGKNPHSAEILPDGNIVTAESSSGEINTFVVDTINVVGSKANTVKLGNAHNVVWDKKREYLYATATITSGTAALFRFKYDNSNPDSPKLTNQTRIYTFDKESGAHDLFPVYGETDKLWLTAASAVYQFDLTTDTPTCTKIYDLGDIKSICNGPDGILMLKPEVEWWAEGLVDENCNSLFNMSGSKIYKGRWMINNTFSYPEQHDFVLGEN